VQGSDEVQVTPDESDVLKMVQTLPGRSSDSRTEPAAAASGNSVNHRFKFTTVFDMAASQESIFDAVALPICQRFLAGFNCTIFAYGQTGD
jgi:hypothetical protein